MPTKRLLNHIALFVTLPSLLFILAALWLCARCLDERRVAQQTATLDAVATQACTALDPLLSADDVSAARRLVAEVGRTPGATGCSLTLLDGRVFADSTARQVDVTTLPANWSGPVDAFDNSTNASPALTKSIDLPGRGRLYLRLNLASTSGQLSLTEITGFAMLAVAALLVALVALRRTRHQLAGLTALADAVCAAAARPGAGADQITLSPTVCDEADAWNRLVTRLHQAETAVRAAQVRALLGDKNAREPTGTREEDAGSRAALESVVDLLSTGVLLLDGAGRVRSANGAGAALLGTEPAKLLNTDVRTLVPDAAFADALASTLARSHGGERRTLEVDRRSQNGGILRMSIRPLRREDQGGGLLTIEDVTQQRIADSSRNQFVAQATHELRAPLTNMRLCLETALEDDIGNLDALTQHLNVMNEETRRLERLVSEMLSVAEIEAGSLRLKEDDVKLDRLFEELKANNAGAAKEKQLQLVFDLPPKLPLLRGDRDKLAATLQNLVNNSIKYTPAGGRVSVSARQEEAWFVIDIADTGIGIPPADQPRIFERFFRANDPRVGKITGTGLGLALARDVAQLHGGDLSFKSELNRGTTFTMRLPVALQPA